MIMHFKPFFDISPSPDSLLRAFEIGPGEMVSLVGGGGKTSLMYALARQISASKKAEVITTTTTKILSPKEGESPHLLFTPGDRFDEKEISDRLRAYRHITIVSEALPDGKLKGISPELAMALARIPSRPLIVIEADGADQRPLKAPREWEPVIPKASSLVVAIAGLDGFGRPLDEKMVFSVERFVAVTGLSPGDPVTANAIADVITHPEGLTKGAPQDSRIVAFLNKTDVEEGLEAGERIAREILKKKNPRIDRVILGSLRSRPPFLRVLTTA
jgi:probable selenium-dependent hydroxylase accessory protein YqeC